ncbi:MAG: hypothetical protein ABJG47_03880 [Ekhidna sp.]
MIAFLSKNGRPLWYHIYLVSILSVLMIFIARSFGINELYNHPQFTEWSEIQNFKLQIHGWKLFLYVSFFIVDAVWALCLLTLFLRILLILRLRLLESDAFKSKDYVIPFFIVFISLAYLLDLLEGIHYLTYSYGSLEKWIVSFKEAAYSIAGLSFIYSALKYWSLFDGGAKKTSHLRSLRIFFNTSYLSIILVVGLIVVGTALPQGYTMMVDLLASPINLIGTYLLITLLSVVVSHYPAYFEAKRFVKDQNRIHWNSFPAKWPFGLVYYWISKDPRGMEDSDNATLFDGLAKTLRYHLGTAMFVAFLYLLGYAGDSIFDGFWFSRQMAFVILILGFWVEYQMRVRSNKWRRRFFYVSIAVSTLLVALSIYFSCSGGATGYGWSIETLNATILATIGLMMSYISFRWNRRFLLKDYEEVEGTKHKSTRKLIMIISGLSLLSFAWLIFMNVNLEWTENHLNPVPILLLYALNYYGIVVIPIKQAQLFGEGEFIKKRRSPVFRFLLPLGIPGLFIFSFFMKDVFNNEMHFMHRLKEEKQLTLNEYAETFAKDTTRSPIMFTSYGGGLMADYWIMLVSQELQEKTQGRFFEHVFNVSGNSGGGLGFANYLNLSHFTDEPVGHTRWRDRIDAVGEFNHLSLDLTLLFGKDMIRKFIPADDRYVDRNYYAMIRYAQLTGDTDTTSFSKTFRSHWESMYSKSGNSFPSLTVSTTSVLDGNLGNAFSLKTDTFNHVFSGIQNTLDINKSNTSINYYDAASLTNRFAVISSVASIAGEGHFLDGGYFDNSGLLNSLELARFIDASDLFRKRENSRFVTVANDTEEYLENVFGKWKSDTIDIVPVGELEAILKTGTSLDKISEHLESEVSQYASKRVKIVLPRIVTYQEVLDYFGGKPIGKLDTVMKTVALMNDSIYAALAKADVVKFEQWGAVETPLARLLSTPSVHYARAMLEFHEGVQNQLKKASCLVNNCEPE